MLPYLRDHHGDPGRLHAEGRVTRVAVEVGARAGRGAVRRPAARGRVHRERHRGGEHRGLGRAARRARRRARGHHRGRALGGARCRCARERDRRHRRRRRPARSLRSRRGRRRRSGPTPCSCPCSSPTTRSARCSRRPRWSTRRAARDVDRARRRVRGRRPRRRRLRRRWAPTSARSPATSSAGRRARPRCSSGAGCASRRSWSAARRSGRGGPASRTSPAIVGFGAAAADALDAGDDGRRERTLLGRDWRRRDGRRACPGSSATATRPTALPHLVCLGIDGVEAEPILLALDQHGVAVHSGSSCSSETLEPSPVLAAMGVDADRSLRVSVGLVVDRRRRRRVPRRVPGRRRIAARTPSVSCRP